MDSHTGAGTVSPRFYIFNSVYHHYISARSKTETIFTAIIANSLLRYPSGNAGGLSPSEIAVLASIVEKETVCGSAYAKTAGVFLNRIREVWFLGSCPALEYALGYHRPLLLLSDLELNSHYNLYRNRGLPPKPTCFFSDEALEAVKNPKKTKYYFFVFDWTENRLVFSRSLSEHNANARRAKKRYAAKYGKDSVHRKYHGIFYENPFASPQFYNSPEH